MQYMEVQIMGLFMAEDMIYRWAGIFKKEIANYLILIILQQSLKLRMSKLI